MKRRAVLWALGVLTVAAFQGPLAPPARPPAPEGLVVERTPGRVLLERYPDPSGARRHYGTRR